MGCGDPRGDVCSDRVVRTVHAGESLKLKIDLQLHTTLGSPDSRIQPSELPAACKLAGIDGVAITEHSPVSFRQVSDLLESEGLALIPAREVSVGPHHVLVFCAEESVLFDLPFRASPVDLDDGRIACIWAHPAFPGGAGVYPPMVPPYEELRGVVHAVEVLNGQRLHVAAGIEAAVNAAASLGLPGSGGSDAHITEVVGKSFTDIDVPSGSDARAMVEAIRGGRVEAALSKAWAEHHGYDYRDDLRTFLK